MSLRRIASALNLSITTISRALAGHSDVSEETRQKIVDEAKRIGYVPNEMARRLQNGRANAIGFVVPADPGADASSVYLQHIRGLWSRLERETLDLLVMAASSGCDELSHYRRLVEGRRVDGMIVSSPRQTDERIDYLLQTRFPFVVIGHDRSRDTAVMSVETDFSAAMRMAVQRLRDFGHRAVACVESEATVGSDDRFEAFRAACLESGIQGVELSADDTIAAGVATTANLMQHPVAPTALVCKSAKLAFNVIQSLQSRGLAVGRDLSIICLEDSPLLRACEPGITVVSQSADKLAYQATDTFLQLRGGLEPKRLFVQPELTAGNTDGPPGGISSRPV